MLSLLTGQIFLQYCSSSHHFQSHFMSVMAKRPVRLLQHMDNPLVENEIKFDFILS